jgi:hypothetical protein
VPIGNSSPPTDTDALIRELRSGEAQRTVIDSVLLCAKAADTIERLTRERDEAQQVCAEAYQVVGVLLDDTGQFETEHGTKILDNLSEHRPVHDDVLPWATANTIERLTRERDEAVADAARYRWLRDGDGEWECFSGGWLHKNNLYGQGPSDLDAAIDAAIATTKAKT